MSPLKAGKESEAVENKKFNSKTMNLILLVAVLLLLAVNVFLVGKLFMAPDNGTPGAARENLSEETEAERLEGRIAIPGYETVELTADSLEQTLCFPNPAQNICYFRISLYLADGTLLWKSGDVAPGENSEPVVLNQPLAAGKYRDAILSYECFTMDENHTQLNGAQTKLMLLVREG